MLDVQAGGEAPNAGCTWQYGAAAVAVVFLLLHVPYLPQSLEDLDSINFALGIRQFDVARHQPHPPGYPVYVALAKAVRVVVPAEAAALSLVGVVAGALSIFALVALFTRLGPMPRSLCFTAAVLTVTAPLYWFTAGRPLSDMAGLAAALAVQAIALAASSSSALLVAALMAGLAAGLRSQVAWLTLPIILLTLVRRRAGLAQTVSAGCAVLAGALVWLVPLVVISGGPAAYVRALFSQGAEDLSGVRMLWTTPTPKQLALALKSAFVDPWAVLAVAAIVLVCAVAGSWRLLRWNRSALVSLVAAFGPYLVFDLLFQETVTIRYALPLVAPVAFLAVCGLGSAGTVPAVVAAAGLAAFDAHVGGTSLAAYAREKAPAFRMLDDMASAAADPLGPPTLAMDRREDLDLRRPIQWFGERMPPLAGRLPAPSRYEWLEVVRYWNQTGKQNSPIWYVADPLRTDIDLVQHAAPQEYLWRLPYPVLMGGTRPYEMRWHRIVGPEWYVGEGWALTPEAAGVAAGDRRDPAVAPILAWVERSAFAGAMIIGGRNLDPLGPAARVTVSDDHDGRQLADVQVPPGAFLLTLAPDGPPREGPDYVALSVRASAGSRVALEQLDVSASRPILGFGTGWHEQEYNPDTGLRWHWLSERGELQVRLPSPSHATQKAAYVLHVEGESPRRYFSRGSRLTIRAGDRVIEQRILDGDFSFDSPIPNDLQDGRFAPLVVETDQTYVPAERSGRTADRRRLGLRVFRCEVRPASPASSRGR
jgi:hypothetical protein